MAVKDVDSKIITTWQMFQNIYASILPQLEENLQTTHNLSLSWYEVLSRLAEDPRGGMRLQELAEAVHLSQSGLTRLVDRMSEADLVKRKPCTHDRRGSYAVITARGLTLLAAAKPVYFQVVEQNFACHLDSDDFQNLQRTFIKILEAGTQQ